MSTWSETEAVAPELAAAVRGRFEAHGMGLLATLRRDGSPRISGIEPLFALGELWLGMMPDSLKGADLRRDPRLALHSATEDKDVTHGDAKIAGRAEEVTDEGRCQAYLDALSAATGFEPEECQVFRVEVTGLSFVQPAGDHLDIRAWREGGEVRLVERS
ncbi:pyridoxamine 5'-phosphate oxidase family protein [Streptacidiphilus sp. PB12-B1b]|uniref:pyridoxamine 5'-phosphate oxidase family protein n=1 Tax=Streptacidiphilus sp. PB12-B1b TaxID=2705012 RepID=UPI0015FA55A2|nr:pyridoxamine 5'-phosphate oxidase family protein [Streptacidiphilus sp. PB12-B1b]QMU78731.1 pyridoxamine 5'-phosphate oxidase family protein [Streptacidiphilus sp. PB12-B1b]